MMAPSCVSLVTKSAEDVRGGYSSLYALFIMVVRIPSKS